MVNRDYKRGDEVRLNVGGKWVKCHIEVIEKPLYWISIETTVEDARRGIRVPVRVLAAYALENGVFKFFKQPDHG